MGTLKTLISVFIVFLSLFFALIGLIFSFAAIGFTYIGESLIELYEEKNIS